MPEPSTSHPPRPAPIQLTEAEKALLREALKRARQADRRHRGEESVRQVLRVRRWLAKELDRLHDPRRAARPWRIAGWGLSISLAAAVLAAAGWRATVRLDSPVPALDDPVMFLLWFGAAFLLAWVPALVGVWVGRVRRRRMELSDTPEIEPALRVFDVNMVKGWVKEKPEA